MVTPKGACRHVFQSILIQTDATAKPPAERKVVTNLDVLSIQPEGFVHKPYNCGAPERTCDYNQIGFDLRSENLDLN